jgi:glycosyltransferase involved in cell wall biosynthesis
MAQAHVSVVLCSHNGSAKLPRTLEALDAVEKPDPTTEIIFVDNASTDDTFSKFPESMAGAEVIRLREPRRGKSVALNTGIRAAHGTYVAFLDDDVRPVRHWLSAYLDAARRFPETNVFCGQVRPDFESEPPNWLDHLCTIGRSFATTPVELNDRIREVEFAQAKGNNLFIKRASFETAMFDEERFNYDTTGGRGGDTYMVKRLTENGPPPLFVPEACVHHWIARHEMTAEAVADRYRKIGHLMEKRDWLEGAPSDLTRKRTITKYRRRLRISEARKMLAALTNNYRLRGELLVRIARLEGRIEYLRTLDQ